ncbi:ABC transporter substrate-binding protein [Derxia gummosa]|uniref:ABC transporter substrate-binding protein n=1 Tax=Derxia gummosa DSM 723 TaxID=1121388 RepID=A0A8B6X698_9BURK|nr:extracellular solute-binding protein [Derxia gummosa]
MTFQTSDAVAAAAARGPLRRRLLGLLPAALAAFGARRATAAPARTVRVLTAYPDEVLAAFEAGFEQANPGLHVQWIWRMPHDALPWLSEPGQHGVDVYWSASPRTYAALKQRGAFRKLGIDDAALPASIGRTRIADPDGYFRATEVAGYGWAYDDAALRRLGVAVPRDWPELADPALAGRIALPIPARVGFAPVMVDLVLQAWGWERGWALWSEIAGNARLVDRGATFITDEVGEGRAALGLTIDFFAASAVARGAGIGFGYPLHNGINPGAIAITAGAPDPAAAEAFARFVLSAEGQAILARPAIRKLPVRPEVYRTAAAGSFNPFAAAEAGGMDYDNDLGRPRLGLVAALFQHWLVEGHDELVALWRRVHAAEAAGRDVAAARAALETPPAAAGVADDAALRRAFEQIEGGDAHGPRAVIDGWRDATRAARARAAALVEAAGG